MKVLLAITLVCGCTPYDWSWPQGATVRIEQDIDADGLSMADWRWSIHTAANVWAWPLGDACPFPYAFDASGDYVITLIAVNRWPHGRYAAMAFGDRIDVRDDTTPHRAVAVIAHELGHTFGLVHAAKGSGELMAPGVESALPTERDIARASKALGCVSGQ